MKRYHVRMTASTNRQIAQCANYIGEESGCSDIAKRWSRKIYQQIATLSIYPRRNAIAQENDYRDYEIRRQLIGNYVALYTIDEKGLAVNIIGFRHAKQLPATQELPTIK